MTNKKKRKLLKAVVLFMVTILCLGMLTAFLGSTAFASETVSSAVSKESSESLKEATTSLEESSAKASASGETSSVAASESAKSASDESAASSSELLLENAAEQEVEETELEAVYVRPAEGEITVQLAEVPEENDKFVFLERKVAEDGLVSYNFITLGDVEAVEDKKEISVSWDDICKANEEELSDFTEKEFLYMTYSSAVEEYTEENFKELFEAPFTEEFSNEEKPEASKSIAITSEVSLQETNVFTLQRYVAKNATQTSSVFIDAEEQAKVYDLNGNAVTVSGGNSPLRGEYSLKAAVWAGDALSTEQDPGNLGAQLSANIVFENPALQVTGIEQIEYIAPTENEKNTRVENDLVYGKYEVTFSVARIAVALVEQEIELEEGASPLTNATHIAVALNGAEQPTQIAISSEVRQATYLPVGIESRELTGFTIEYTKYWATAADGTTVYRIDDNTTAVDENGKIFFEIVFSGLPHTVTADELISNKAAAFNSKNQAFIAAWANTSDPVVMLEPGKFKFTGSFSMQDAVANFGGGSNPDYPSYDGLHISSLFEDGKNVNLAVHTRTADSVYQLHGDLGVQSDPSDTNTPDKIVYCKHLLAGENIVVDESLKLSAKYEQTPILPITELFEVAEGKELSVNFETKHPLTQNAVANNMKVTVNGVTITIGGNIVLNPYIDPDTNLPVKNGYTFSVVIPQNTGFTDDKKLDIKFDVKDALGDGYTVSNTTGSLAVLGNQVNYRKIVEVETIKMYTSKTQTTYAGFTKGSNGTNSYAADNYHVMIEINTAEPLEYGLDANNKPISSIILQVNKGDGAKQVVGTLIKSPTVPLTTNTYYAIFDFSGAETWALDSEYNEKVLPFDLLLNRSGGVNPTVITQSVYSDVQDSTKNDYPQYNSDFYDGNPANTSNILKKPVFYYASLSLTNLQLGLPPVANSSQAKTEDGKYEIAAAGDKVTLSFTSNHKLTLDSVNSTFMNVPSSSLPNGWKLEEENSYKYTIQYTIPSEGITVGDDKFIPYELFLKAGDSLEDTITVRQTENDNENTANGELVNSFDKVSWEGQNDSPAVERPKLKYYKPIAETVAIKMSSIDALDKSASPTNTKEYEESGVKYSAVKTGDTVVLNIEASHPVKINEKEINEFAKVNLYKNSLVNGEVSIKAGSSFGGLAESAINTENTHWQVVYKIAQNSSLEYGNVPFSISFIDKKNQQETIKTTNTETTNANQAWYFPAIDVDIASISIKSDHKDKDSGTDKPEMAKNGETITIEFTTKFPIEKDELYVQIAKLGETGSKIAAEKIAIKEPESTLDGWKYTVTFDVVNDITENEGKIPFIISGKDVANNRFLLVYEDIENELSSVNGYSEKYAKIVKAGYAGTYDTFGKTNGFDSAAYDIAYKDELYKNVFFFKDMFVTYYAPIKISEWDIKTDGPKVFDIAREGNVIQLSFTSNNGSLHLVQNSANEDSMFVKKEENMPTLVKSDTNSTVGTGEKYKYTLTYTIAPGEFGVEYDNHYLPYDLTFEDNIDQWVQVIQEQTNSERKNATTQNNSGFSVVKEQKLDENGVLVDDPFTAVSWVGEDDTPAAQVPDIIYYAPIKVYDLVVVSDNEKTPKTVAKNGNTVSVSFNTTHPVQVKNSTLAQKGFTLSSKDDDEMNWTGTFTVPENCTDDTKQILLEMLLGDVVNEDLSFNNDGYPEDEKVFYYMPITITDVVITSSNAQDKTKYAKDGDQVTVAFNTNHMVDVSSASIAQKGATITNVQTNGQDTSPTQSWTISYTLANGDLKDLSEVPFAISVDDIAGNGPVSKANTDEGVVNKIKYYAPIEATTSIASNNARPEYAKNADAVMVTNITQHEVSVEGASIFGRDASASGNGSEKTEVSYTIPAGESTLPEGKVTFSFALFDPAGNTLPISETNDASLTEVIYDRTAPEVSISPGFIGFTNQDVSMTYLYTDTNLDASGVVLKINNLPQGGVSKTSEFTYSVPVTLSEEGYYYIEGEVTDLAGNVSETKAKVSFVIDKTKPVVTLSDMELGGKKTYKGGFALNEIFEIDESYVKEVLCTLTDNTGVYDWSVDSPIERDGKKTVFISATDMAGNASIAMSYDFYVDGTAPQPEVTYAAENQVLSIGDNKIVASQGELTVDLAAIHIGDEEPDHFTTLQLLDAKGNIVQDLLKESGYEPADSYTVLLEKGSYGDYTLRIEAGDEVGNETGVLDYKISFKDLSWWQKFYQNKPLFFGAIGAVVLISAGTAFYLYRRKKSLH